MRIHVHNKEIFDVVEADTLVLPIDAAAPGLEGNICRQLMKRVGVTEMSQLYAPPPSYPFHGQCHWSFLGYKNYNWLCVIGTLKHTYADRANNRALVRDALGQAIAHTYTAEVGKRLACPLPVGGGRVSAVDAAYLVANLCSEATAKYKYGSLPEMHIAERDSDIYEVVRSILG
jgi:hypothetical protein